MSPQHDRESLSVGEFNRSTQSLERLVQRGFTQVNDRFDEVAEVAKGHGERIAVLEADREERRQSHVKANAKTVSLGSAAAAGVYVFVELVKHIKPALAQVLSGFRL